MDLTFQTVDFSDDDQRRTCYDTLVAGHVGLPGEPLPPFDEWDSFVQNLADDEGYALVLAVDGPKTVAAATLSLPTSPDVSDRAVVHVYVLPEVRRQGIATAFVRHFLETLPKQRVAVMGAARVSEGNTAALDFATSLEASTDWQIDQFAGSSGLDRSKVEDSLAALADDISDFKVRTAAGGLTGKHLAAYLDFVNETLEIDLEGGYDEQAYYEELESYEEGSIAVLDTIVTDASGHVVMTHRLTVPPEVDEPVMIDLPVALETYPAEVHAACLLKSLRSTAKLFPRYHNFLCMVRDDDVDLRKVLTDAGLVFSYTNRSVEIAR